ncbi:MAG: tyrosine-type recombinase/integrase [candidate division Zixibacteria bacterium]|nr:tyrosine-type recombinase/integrase [candidate division Zixibacteria bacterium]
MACQYLKEYIQKVRPHLSKRNKEERALFIGRQGKRMHKLIIQRMVKEYARQAGIKKRVTPHTFRHSCATHMIKNRASLRHIQEILGHESLTSTQKYIQLTITDLKEAHKKYHPREKDAKKLARD